MEGPRRDYAKWNKSDIEKTKTILFHVYVESKKQNKWANKTESQIQRTKWRLKIGGGWGKEWKKVNGIKKYKLPIKTVTAI